MKSLPHESNRESRPTGARPQARARSHSRAHDRDDLLRSPTLEGARGTEGTHTPSSPSPDGESSARFGRYARRGDTIECTRPYAAECAYSIARCRAAPPPRLVPPARRRRSHASDPVRHEEAGRARGTHTRGAHRCGHSSAAGGATNAVACACTDTSRAADTEGTRA
jgi:hypothetical protein